MSERETQQAKIDQSRAGAMSLGERFLAEAVKELAQPGKYAERTLTIKAINGVLHVDVSRNDHYRFGT